MCRYRHNAKVIGPLNVHFQVVRHAVTGKQLPRGDAGHREHPYRGALGNATHFRVVHKGVAMDRDALQQVQQLVLVDDGNGAAKLIEPETLQDLLLDYDTQD